MNEINNNIMSNFTLSNQLIRDHQQLNISKTIFAQNLYAKMI